MNYKNIKRLAIIVLAVSAGLLAVQKGLYAVEPSGCIWKKVTNAESYKCLVEKSIAGGLWQTVVQDEVQDYPAASQMQGCYFTPAVNYQYRCKVQALETKICRQSGAETTSAVNTCQPSPTPTSTPAAANTPTPDPFANPAEYSNLVGGGVISYAPLSGGGQKRLDQVTAVLYGRENVSQSEVKLKEAVSTAVDAGSNINIAYDSRTDAPKRAFSEYKLELPRTLVIPNYQALQNQYFRLVKLEVSGLAGSADKETGVIVFSGSPRGNQSFDFTAEYQEVPSLTPSPTPQPCLDLARPESVSVSVDPGVCAIQAGGTAQPVNPASAGSGVNIFNRFVNFINRLLGR